MRMTAAELASRSGGRVVEGDDTAVCTSYGFDSRALDRGACFVALRGHRDGHDFVDDAFHAGAVVALVSRERPGRHPLPAGLAVVRVADTVAGLARAAASVRAEHGALEVVAVAGSTGKTSTKDLVAAALSAGRRVHANAESYNNEFGLPLTILGMDAATEVLVTEMGERFPGDLAALCEVARPTVGIVTNVGLAHAEHLGGPGGAAAAMAELLGALPPEGVAVLPADDPWTPWLRARCVAPVVTAGTDPGADYAVSSVRVDPHLRASFTLAGTTFDVPIRGAHQVGNAALAVAVAHLLGVPLTDAAAAMRDAPPPRWRLEVHESSRGVTVLDDSYNANPASMDAALRSLAHLPARGRRVAVLGDMRELGAHADAAHTAVGRLAVELGIDVVIGVGPGGADIAASAAGCGETVTVADAAAALAAIEERVGPGDAVLVKASRAVGLESVAAALLDEPARARPAQSGAP
jgi:UDP-N-acetylmuramoyl-tripeptide--D-alanyl-D-alanine ligase